METVAIAPTATSEVETRVQLSPVLCFALEQAGVPLVYGVEIHNHGSGLLSDVVLTLQLEPELGEIVRYPLPDVPPGEPLNLGPLDYPLIAGKLRQIEESEIGSWRWQLTSGENVLAAGRQDVDVLAFNHWPGLRVPPLLLASYVLPNHPAVATMLLSVRERLQLSTADPALDGYQSRSVKRVTAMVQALYDAIQATGMTYVGVPASFEASGQKVRLPDRLLQENVGCCLDLSLFVAACFEQMGLHPLIAVVPGHAFPGVWVSQDRFPEGVVEDAARIRTAIALGDVIMFDSSAMIAGERPSLGQAVAIAQQSLADDQAFHCVIDVKAVRMAGYRPMPLRQASVADVAAVELPTDRELVPNLAGDDSAQAGRDQTRNRLQRWQEKLLDLSLRNRLLNFPIPSKGAVLLEVAELALLEDRLAAEQRFEILPPPAVPGSDMRDPLLAKKRMPPDEWRQLLLEDMGKGVLHASLGDEALQRTMKALDRDAREAFEEGGSYVLYLALGFIRWYESAQGEKERYAPLLLYPVALEFDRAKRRYSLRRQPEDPIANITLVEKMRRDFAVDLSMLLQLETDDSGIDVPKLLRSVREAIRQMPRWDVVDQAAIGLFSFTKFLMWRDLDSNAAQLLENPVVRHLASSDQRGFEQEVAAVSPESLDLEMPPHALPCVVDSDSTQMSAVASALAGRSFVLQGPPGTGKSQTITNMVGALLFQGKTVLFVSEKMAALDVVFRRLKEVGLGDFCLELHSHKSNKRDVIESLVSTLRRADRVSGVPWNQRSQEIQELRTKLNAVAVALHQKHPIGWTFHQGVSRLIGLAAAPEIRFAMPDILDMDADTYRRVTTELTEFSVRAKAAEPLADNPWRLCRILQWTSTAEESLKDCLAEMQEALAAVELLPGKLGEAFGFPIAGSTADLAMWIDLAGSLSSAAVPSGALTDAAWQDHVARGRRYTADERAWRQLRADLASRWQDEFLTMDVTFHLQQMQHAASSWPLLSNVLTWKAKRALKPFCRQASPDTGTVLKDLARIRQLQAQERQLGDERTWLQQCLGGLWDSRANDLELAEKLLADSQAMHTQATFLRSGGMVTEREFAALATRTQVQQDRDRFAACHQAGKQALQALESREAALRESLQLEPEGAWPSWPDPAHRQTLAERISLWQQAIRRYRPWCHYQEGMGWMVKADLSALVDAHRQGRVAAADLADAFERNLLTRWAAAIRDQEPVLGAFDADVHSRLVDQFALLDRDYINLARQWGIATLEQRLPPLNAPVADSSERGILDRQAKLKTRHLPVRRLLQSLPDLAPRLKPCFMMSPLSIAQYLPADWRQFDVVVFDEASQIGTHDAIGAIARGKQVIIVGDSKQLPPTSFFQRQSADDDGAQDENDIVELESILDEATAKQLPEQSLGWHYRSRHDSLIDFSNRHYYQGKLFVFPAAQRLVDGLGLSWHPVPNGEYQRTGKAALKSTNPIEAQALVDHLVQRLRVTPAGSRTFGVVTFSMAQQRLIMDLLDEKRSQYPGIEGHFQGDEGVFVKNLENVQGDERDEIYFSICYAKDANGHLLMNFGPLNRKGGERRLNVAVTRARCQLRVFSTLTWDQIDLTRTGATGAAHLRGFLQLLSQQGESAREATERQPGNDLERAIKAELEAMGYEVHANIGCGSYRVDLAVVDPGTPGTYVLGIETDGESYGNAATARDRERLRHGVLEGLGWRLHRIWALAWWQDPEAEKEHLRLAIEAAIAHAEASREEAAHLAAASQLVESAQAPLEEAVDAPVAFVSAPVPDLIQSAGSSPTADVFTGIPVAGPTIEPTDPELAGPYGRAYQPVSVPLSPLAGDAERFYASSSLTDLHQAINHVVKGEGPIHIDLLARRIMPHFSLKSLTDRVRRRLMEVCRQISYGGTIRIDGSFLWPDLYDQNEWQGFRVGTGESARDLEHIPPEELAEAAHWILSANLSMAFEDLVKEVARGFAIQRVGKNVVAAIEPGITLLEAQGRCSTVAGTVRWLNPNAETAPSPTVAEPAVAEPTVAAPSLMTDDDGAKLVFAHLERHGSITEGELTNLLGSPRSARRFALAFDDHVKQVPFGVRIEITPTGKRYVRQS